MVLLDANRILSPKRHLTDEPTVEYRLMAS